LKKAQNVNIHHIFMKALTKLQGSYSQAGIQLKNYTLTHFRWSQFTFRQTLDTMKIMSNTTLLLTRKPKKTSDNFRSQLMLGQNC